MDDEVPTETVGWVKEMWKRGSHALTHARREYALNGAFFEGEQWTVFNNTQGSVATLPREPGDERARLVENRIEPNLIVNLAKLSRRTLSFEVPPSASDDGAITAARLAENALEHSRIEDGWERVRIAELMAVMLGATAAVVVEWDPNRGAELGIDPETQQVVQEGNASLKALSIDEFTLEPGSRDPRDARWFIMATAIPVEQARDHYNLDWTPDKDANPASGPLAKRLMADRGYTATTKLCTVYTLYWRPCREKPQGQYAVVINDKVVLDQAWPFKFKNPNRLNIRVFRQQQIDGRWTGKTMVSTARPPQVLYNYGLSIVAEHLKMAGNARLAIPDNSGVSVDDLSDNAGEPIFYDGVSSSAPHWIQSPEIPRWVREFVQERKAAVDDAMAVHDISRGEAPGDRNSGTALSVLAEQDETPLGLMAHDQAEGWSEIASMVLEMWASNVHEWRTASVTITGTNVPVTTEWTGRHLRNQTKAIVPLDSTQPFSRAAMSAWLTEMAGTFPQMIPQDPAVLARILELPQQSQMLEAANADVAECQRENALMLAGEIPSLGDDPFPMPWQEHAVHIAEHQRLRKSSAYVYAPSQVRQIIDSHIKAHEAMAFEETQQQIEREAAMPGLSAVPQANEPPGSEVPIDAVEQVAPTPQPGSPMQGAAA